MERKENGTVACREHQLCMIDFHVISICLPRISSADLGQRVTEGHGAAHAWSVVSKTTFPYMPPKGQGGQDRWSGGQGEKLFPSSPDDDALRLLAAATKVEG